MHAPQAVSQPKYQMRTPTHREALAIIGTTDLDAPTKALMTVYIQANQVCEGWDIKTVARVADTADRAAGRAEALIETLRRDLQNEAEAKIILQRRVERLEAIIEALAGG
ncbi:hypothetical protein OKW76_07100 [Sphingomonas sp. S1-29]|uniref:hypothetical protein n=1 Tax=Sphingomonas sp. S1-29 TaxID=2991074 RepID=UPI00223F3D1A|nr:hypothetical protein [Sphingomonas sp. S1-29]UZK70782.1 hypothetical protein OKW76_07100 [Sphingomonas sp. S1-29]